MQRLAVSLRLASCFSVMSSLLFLGLGAFLLSRPTEGNRLGGVLRIEPPPESLGHLLPGSKTLVSFTVTNLSSEPVWMAGIESVCMPWGCVEGLDFPAGVPPLDSRTFRLELRTPTTKFTGKFAHELVVYSDARGNERIPLELVGRVVQREVRH